jgi:hypothetical protein
VYVVKSLFHIALNISIVKMRVSVDIITRHTISRGCCVKSEKRRKRMPLEMNKHDLEILEGRFVDNFGIAEILSGLSKICSDKAEHAAVNWQDTSLAKNWMQLSAKLDRIAANIEK